MAALPRPGTRRPRPRPGWGLRPLNQDRIVSIRFPVLRVPYRNRTRTAKPWRASMVLSHQWDVSGRLARSPRNRRPWWVSHPVSGPPRAGVAGAAGGRVGVVVSAEIDALPAPHLEAYVSGRSPADCTVLELDLAGV